VYRRVRERRPARAVATRDGGGSPGGCLRALGAPHAGSNPAEMSTEARREGDEYVIDGEKQWITNGERAGVYVLFAKTDRDDPGSVTQFLVPADVDGLGWRERGQTRPARERHHEPHLRRRSDPGRKSVDRGGERALGRVSHPHRRPDRHRRPVGGASHSVRSTRRWLTAKSATSSAAPFRTSRRSGTNSPRWRPKFGPRAC